MKFCGLDNYKANWVCFIEAAKKIWDENDGFLPKFFLAIGLAVGSLFCVFGLEPEDEEENDDDHFV